MLITPLHEVGGWGRPQTGRLSEKRRGRFSSCQMARGAGTQRSRWLWYTAYSVSPPGTPLPIFIFAFYIFAMKYNKNGIDPGGPLCPAPSKDPCFPPKGAGATGLGPRADITASPFWGAVDIEPTIQPRIQISKKLCQLAHWLNLIRSLVYTICCGTQHISSGGQHIYDMLFLCAHGTHVKQWVSCGHSLVDWDVDFPRADPLLPSKSR